MNDIFALLDRMKKLQYYDFLRYALGMKYFLIDDGQEIRAQIDDDEDVEKPSVESKKNRDAKIRILAYLYEAGKRKKTFLVTEGDFESKKFRDNLGNDYDARKFFGNVDSFLMWSIMMGVLGLENYSRNEVDSNNDIGRILVEKHSLSSYGFILGAGVNSRFGIGNWEALVNDIRENIKRIKGIPKGSDRLLELEKTMSNTNYISPQILKDLDTRVYYDVIYNNLYGSFSVNKTSRELDPAIEDTTLYQVARIVSSNKDANVLTFNYDDLLEQVLRRNFSSRFSSCYYKAKNQNWGIRIIHPHGFYPYGKAGEAHAHAIVFSSFEYMDGYLRASTYARKKLYQQIMQPCILIGNSLSDYEEQKVFYLHHKRYLTHFCFLFTKRSDPADQWMDVYKSVYFLNMGVIPVFFDDYDEMIDYLKTKG